MPTIDSPPLSTIPPQLDATTPITNALQRIPLPSPEKLFLRDLANATRFRVWKGELWSYLRLASFVGYAQHKGPGSLNRKPTTRWEHIAQAYVIRRLLSYGVKERLVVAGTDMDDPAAVMEALEREQGVLFGEMEEDGKDWEQVEKE